MQPVINRRRFLAGLFAFATAGPAVVAVRKSKPGIFELLEKTPPVHDAINEWTRQRMLEDSLWRQAMGVASLAPLSNEDL